MVIVEEAPQSGGWGGDIVTLAADEGIYYLEPPIKRVSLIPYSPPLEDAVIPTAERIADVVRSIID